MKKNTFARILCMLLVCILAFTAAGCTTAPGQNDEPGTKTFTDGETLGEGSKTFTFTVVDVDGNETTATIHTDAETVGEALITLGLIEGEDGEWGLYVKTVNGLTLDYETDGKYWAFYQDGEYSMNSVDLTEITEGAVYTFKAE